MSLTIAVTGMNARADNPGPGLAVARCLKESALAPRVIGFGYEALDPALYHRGFVDRGYLLPYPSHGEDALLARLTELHEREHFDVLIPCLDAEMQSFARLAPTLTGMGIRTFIPNSHQLALRSKDRLPELAAATGISSPRTQAVYQANFFHTCEAQGWRYPLMVKGLFYDAKLAYNADEAVAIFHRIAGEWGVPILAQSWILGEEINLAGVGDGLGGLAGAVMMKKRALTDKGKGWAGISIHDDELLFAAKRFCEVTKWRGGLELEMLRDEQGNLHLIEINPRFPAWIYLSAGVGCNLPDLLVRLALGEQLLPTPPTPAGVLFIRYAEEAIVSLADFENITVLGETLRFGALA
ncbi:MAG: ATP-grasp domain-containing protein [Methylococcales bacterium]|nr:ATP-grasp domain-containing protein [Methylococcales bacterium]